MNEYKKKILKNNIRIVIISGFVGGIFCFFLLSGDDNFFARILMGVSMGVFISLGLIFLDSLMGKSLNKKPLPLKLLLRTIARTAYISLLYWLMLFLFFFSSFLGNSAEENTGWGILHNSTALHYFLPTLLFSFLATFIMEAASIFSHLLGQSTLFRLFSGRYHKPFEEDRIFMFLDLKGSTTIAEARGNRAFHSFINDFFYAITPSILESKGEIYKYIGDEVIVSWNMKLGVKDGNFLRSFFLMEEAIQRESEMFEKKYGTIPKFRAGIHTGKVVVGEMGDFRKEIAYLGDVVNTTARIIDEAGKRGKTLLISSEAQQLLSADQSGSYIFSVIDNMTLRGKTNETELIEVERK